MAKPSIPQGTRDFGPEVVRKRNFIFTTIRQVFELYGFEPLETPAMENLDILMGKYGEEGDKLIFRILNNGLDQTEKHEKARTDFENILKGKNVSGITERALRYDLTIPFARFVAMNAGRLIMPFKRYQIQPVWRADRPQKGRYREFYQCDADIVGSNSLWNEVDLAGIYHQVFIRLGIAAYELRINSRKFLSALADRCGGSGQLTNITVAIDKLDKIGPDKVKAELKDRGLSHQQVGIIEEYLRITGSNEEKLQAVAQLLGDSETAVQGKEEIRFILDTIHASSSADKPNLSLDLTLARGLNYYTGIIFEAKAPSTVRIGSIGGGGRYDNLTGSFGVPGIPGVGISFGVDRIYDVMEELSLFPEEVQTGSQVLFVNLGERESRAAYNCMQELRARNIRCELYPEQSKFDRQLKYADRKKIPFAVIIGSRELETESCVVKDLRTGDQQVLPLKSLENLSFI